MPLQIKQYFLRLLRWLTILILLLMPQYALATATSEADVKDIIITTSDTHLLLFCLVKNAFTPEMLKGVQNGISLTFEFRVLLERERSAWVDSTLIKKTLYHTLRYDSLKEEYTVRLSEKKAKEITTASLEEAMAVMGELNGLKVISIDSLEPDRFYTLGIRVKLEKKTLPLNMHYIVPFISLWDFETDWREVRFRY